MLTDKAAAAKDRRTGRSVQMQHRHFCFIADVIRNLPDGCNRGTVAADFMAALQGSNPRFDKHRFLVACGYGELVEFIRKEA